MTWDRPQFGTVVRNVGQYTAPPTTVPPTTTTKAPVTVANVVGQNYVNATNALSSQGLSVVVQRVTSASVPKDDVISQNPTAFSSVPSGSTITLQVSNGP